MARNLYRIYLYSVFIAMLIFAAVGLGMLLQTLFSLTPLRGAYGTIPKMLQSCKSQCFLRCLGS